jgi:hypothetical protein
MKHIEYEYKIVRQRGEDTKFLAAVNRLASEGWRVIHYSYAAAKDSSLALLELCKEGHTGPLNGPK